MPNLSCGIIGLPNVGKSTLFNALTKKAVPAENYPFCTIDPNIGIVDLYDKRLEDLAIISQSKQIIYATVAFVDIAGLVKGAAKGEGLGNQFLSHIRETDAIIEVVRCFEEEKIVHVGGAIDPCEDTRTIHLELILSDLQLAETTYQRLLKQTKGKKEPIPLLSLIKKIIDHFNNELPLRTLSLSQEEEELLKPYPFLTKKKILYVANIQEKDINNPNNPLLSRLQDCAQQENSLVIPICAKIEQELAQLSLDEAKTFLSSLGLSESGLDRLIRSAFHLLGLITFFTTGEKETKAWTIRKGSKAVEAAGKIHSDIANGFIRAEVISYEDMIHFKGRVKAKEAGKARLEGKDYVVQDGDVILFYHN